jgi:flagellar biosynthesis GTPase FlhF
MSASRRVRILTDEQKEARRVTSRQHRAQQLEEQKQAERDRARHRRAQRSEEQKQAERDRVRHRRAAMTDEQKEAERQRRRHRARDRREREREQAAARSPPPVSHRRSRHYQSALLRADGTYNPVSSHHIGSLSQRCPYEGCGALRFPGETLKSLCCHGGKAVLPPVTPMPAFLYGLYLGRDALSLEQSASLSPAQSHLLDDRSLSTHFREYVRSYNSAMGLASLTFNQEEI